MGFGYSTKHVRYHMTMVFSTKHIMGAAAKRVLTQERIDALREGPLRKYMVESVISREKPFARIRRRLLGHEKPTLFHLDVHLTDHCNLNCRGCEHYSSISKPVFADFEEVRADLARLASLFKTIEQIYLLGGEPLLHPQVNDFIYGTRELFPATRLYLMTNGILVTRMDDDFWKALADTKTTLLCDSYPINIDRARINELGVLHGVTIEWMAETSEFFKIPVDVTGSQNAAASFNRCRGLSNCAIVRDGKIYPCAHIAYAHILIDEFGEERDLDALVPREGDFVDIYKTDNGDEIIDALMSPSPWCANCAFDDFSTYEWGRTDRDPREWFGDEA